MARAKKATQGIKQVKPANGFSVRPSKAFRPLIQQLAAQDGKSEGQFVNVCAEAIVRMILAEEAKIPAIVRKLKVLRAQRATMTSEEQPFPSREIITRMDEDADTDDEPSDFPIPGADAGF